MPEYVDVISDRGFEILDLVVDVGQEIQQHNDREVSDSPIAPRALMRRDVKLWSIFNNPKRNCIKTMWCFYSREV